MFAYCLNNPIILEDSEGTRPVVGASLHNETAEEKEASFAYMRKTYAKDNGLLYKIRKVCESLIYNFEISAGVGQGLYVGCDVLDLVSIQGGMYGNYICFLYENGKWEIGQELNTELSATFLFLNLGVSEYIFTQKGKNVVEEIKTGVYSDETLTIFSVAVYPTVGFSFRVGYDIIQFCDDMREIFDYGRIVL